MTNESLWEAAGEDVDFQTLGEHLAADVIVVGGGITGVTAAHLLAREGKRVVLLEAHRVGKGATGYSTGNLYGTLARRLATIRSKHGDEVLRGVVASRLAAVDLIERLVTELQLGCGFERVPWFLSAADEAADAELRDEQEAIVAAGLSVDSMASLPLPIPSRRALRVEGQAQLSPCLYVQRLARAIASDRCRVFERSAVTAIEDDPVGFRLQTGSGSVSAPVVIHATHSPKGVMAVQTALGPYREYGIAVRLTGAVPPPGIYWSTGELHHSVRTYRHGGADHLVVVGGHHKTGQCEDTEACYAALEAWARRYFVFDTVDHRWSAQGFMSADALPYIGKHGNNGLYIATGFGTDGLTYGTLAAMILTNLISGREDPWAALYATGRFTPLASAKDFLAENLDALGQYLQDLPGNVDVKDFAAVGRGEGKTVSVGGEKLAAYRDDRDVLHVVSAVCTHMSCIVKWNNAERSWDCPCHGSRFTVDGTVIEGPALFDLPRKS